MKGFMSWFEISVGVLAIAALIIFRNWFFGEPDDSKGYPYSRDKKRKSK
jgi:hypothetical protein